MRRERQRFREEAILAPFPTPLPDKPPQGGRNTSLAHLSASRRRACALAIRTRCSMYSYWRHSCSSVGDSEPCCRLAIRERIRDCASAEGRSARISSGGG